MQQQLQKAMMKYPVADIKYKLRFLQQEVHTPARGCASVNEHQKRGQRESKAFAGPVEMISSASRSCRDEKGRDETFQLAFRKRGIEEGAESMHLFLHPSQLDIRLD